MLVTPAECPKEAAPDCGLAGCLRGRASVSWKWMLVWRTFSTDRRYFLQAELKRAGKVAGKFWLVGPPMHIIKHIAQTLRCNATKFLVCMSDLHYSPGVSLPFMTPEAGSYSCMCLSSRCCTCSWYACHWQRQGPRSGWWSPCNQCGTRRSSELEPAPLRPHLSPPAKQSPFVSTSTSSVLSCRCLLQDAHPTCAQLCAC